MLYLYTGNKIFYINHTSNLSSYEILTLAEAFGLAIFFNKTKFLPVINMEYFAVFQYWYIVKKNLMSYSTFDELAFTLAAKYFDCY